tara:strand:+ start:7243 stop:7956 length:714 start_codon:yes stop_codon:yes gene_type:complete
MKLNFRAKPLKLPPMQVRDVENPPMKPIIKPPKLPKPAAREDAFDVFVVATRFIETHWHPRWLAFPAAFAIVFLLRMYVHVAEVHKIQSLVCKKARQELRCIGKPKGTFVVNVPPACDTVYEIDGVPFSAAERDGVFRVPADKLVVKDVIGDCHVQAYMDSRTTTVSMPFTWVTTRQHKAFTIYVDNQMVVESAVADLFDSTSRGVWVAYTFDFSRDVRDVRVVGDGTDIIHTYPAR